MKKLFAVLTTIFILFGSISCNKDEDNSNPAAPGTVTGQKITTTISGKVYDNLGALISGATVTIGSKTATSNLWGIYLLEDVEVPADRAVITASKTGYWDQQKGLIASANATNYANIVLFPDNKTYTVNALSGGTINLPGGTSITFPANAFSTASGTAYTGTVLLTAHEILTNEQTFGMKIPGGDLLATDKNNQSVLLISYGMAGAELYDAVGNKLKLAAGKQAQISFPIVSTQTASAPATIPLWHYDNTAMKWIEEGTATKTGNNYVGTVSHFSWWNCDISNSLATLTFTIVDCLGLPLENALVKLNIISSGWVGYSWTNSLGICSGLVPANTTFSFEILDPTQSWWSGQTGFIGGPIGPFITNTNNLVPTITISTTNCGAISGEIRNCSNTLTGATVALLQNNQLISFQVTQTGLYNFSGLSAGTYQLVAYKGLLTTDTTAVVSTSVNTVMNLNLCDTLSTGNNFQLTFTSTLVPSIAFSLDVNSATFVDTPNEKFIKVIYTDSASGNTGIFHINVPQYANGTYPWDLTTTYISGSMFYAGVSYTMQAGIPGQTILTATPAVGGFMNGSFTGSVSLTGGINSIPGTLSGNFSLLRIQ